MDTERWVRQILVDGIGVAGQRKICASVARVGGDARAERVATTYALAAGFSRIEPSTAAAEPGAPREWVVTDEARDALAGARAAVRAIHEALRGQ